MMTRWYKRITGWYRNLSLNVKIILLVCIVAFLPLGLVMTFSLTELYKQSEEQLAYAMNQGYDQTSQAVEEKLMRIHNISTLLAVNDTVNLNLKMSADDTSLADQLISFENLSSYAYSMEMTFESSNILFYIDDAFPVVNSQSGRYRSIREARQTKWYQELRENSGRPTWVSFSEDIYDKNRDYVAVTRELWNPEDYEQSMGVLAVSLDKQYLENLLVGSVQQQSVYLENQDGTVLAANIPEEETVKLPQEMLGVDDTAFYQIRLEDGDYMVRCTLLVKANLYLVSVVPVKAMKQEISIVGNRIVTVYILICTFAILIFFPLTRTLTSRMQLLKEQMIKGQSGEIKKLDVEYDCEDEVGQLVTHFNEMVDKVEELLKEQYILGQEKTGAELKALQSQINPHFLYNTLDMIGWMAQKNETDNIWSVVQAMSRFYRLTLSRGNDVVTISDEVKMCDAYMEIQRRRYRGRILYEAEVEENILNCLIPKITLQPFLENAIIHGINEKEDARGTVVLNGWLEDGRITLSVTDDGAGMTEEDRKHSGSGSHYGMENIKKRLTLFYGEEIPVRIESSLGIGTCIIIEIPEKQNPGS